MALSAPRKKTKGIDKYSAKKKKEGEKALAYLQNIESCTELTNANIYRINKIVRDEQRSRFLPQKVKKMLNDISSKATEEQRQILASL